MTQACRANLCVMTNQNSKGDLIARLVSLGLGVPNFDTVTSGPAHDRIFSVSVAVNGQVLGAGEGRSKKEAERIASEQALQKLESGTAELQTQSATTPWPIYAQVLAQSVEAALEFAEDDTSLDDVRHNAAQFYRELLAELGHGPDQAE